MEGQLLGGYRVVRRIGAGGMGSVYEATAESRPCPLPAGTRVALKVLKAHLFAQPGFFKRFLREVEAGMRVRHRNVVRTIDADAVEVSGRITHFLVMELVEGQTLRRLIQDLGFVAEDLCRRIGFQIARGLAAIHAAGLVHRDLKPENVLITTNDEVKIMDLGTARLQDGSVRLSLPGQFVGTLFYASPEQLSPEAGDLDGRADLYTLGLTLFELSTGQLPFGGGTAAEMFKQQLTSAAPPVRSLNPELSPFFDAIVANLLSRDRNARIGTADQVAEILSSGEASAWWRDRAGGPSR